MCRIIKEFTAIGGLTIGVLMCMSAAATVIDNFSSAGIRAPIDGYGVTVNAGNLTGSTASVLRSGTGESPFLISIYDAGAEANLSTGQLKAKASLMLLPGQYYNDAYGNFAPGTVQAGSISYARFGDSFRSFTGDVPFAWGQDSVNFHIDVEGYRDDDGLFIPDLSPYFNSGVSLNSVRASLGFTAYQPGTLSAVYRLNTENLSFDDFISTLNYINNNIVYSDLVGITTFGNGENWPRQILTLPNSFDFSFVPAGDFDWVISLNVEVNLDVTTIGVMPVIDLFDTVNVTYSGPAGVTTYSGSGVFPGTLALSAASIPEPSSVFLAALGLAFLFQCKRRAD